VQTAVLTEQAFLLYLVTLGQGRAADLMEKDLVVGVAGMLRDGTVGGDWVVSSNHWLSSNSNKAAS
jgi:hypothetical protein